MNTDVIRRKTRNNKQLFFIVLLLFYSTTVLYSQSRKNQIDSTTTCIYQVLVKEPEYIGIKLINEYSTSTYVFDLLEIKTSNGYQQETTFRRLFYDGEYWYLRSNTSQDKFEGNATYKNLLDYKLDQEKHVVCMCSFWQHTTNSYTYLVSIKGNLVKSINSDVSINQIQTDSSEIQLEIDFLKKFSVL